MTPDISLIIILKDQYGQLRARVGAFASRANMLSLHVPFKSNVVMFTH